jgi:hypothetical protein
MDLCQKELLHGLTNGYEKRDYKHPISDLHYERQPVYYKPNETDIYECHNFMLMGLSIENVSFLNIYICAGYTNSTFFKSLCS